jgi:hypothetical protein
VHTGFWWGNPREIDHFEDLGIDGRIILKCIFKKLHGGSMDWINLHEDTDRWRTVVQAAVNCRVSQNEENFLTVRGPIVFSRTLLHEVQFSSDLHGYVDLKTAV